MPPVSKKTTQRSVKEMLAEKQSSKSSKATKQLPIDDEEIILPPFLLEHTDIRPPAPVGDFLPDPMYSCSPFAREWFSANSNLDEIIDEYLKTISGRQYERSSYVSTVIRAVTSSPLRRLQFPFTRFKFNSLSDEAVGRCLLTNPGISSYEDLCALQKFENRHHIKLCTVSVCMDHMVHDNAIEYLEAQRKKAKLDATKLPVLRKRILFWTVRRKYFEEKKLVENIYLQGVTLQQLEEISNFRKIATKLMIEDGYDVQHYDTFAELTLKMFKEVPEFRETLKYFLVDPMFNLICNSMTLEQQHDVAEDVEKFYTLTNAGRINRKLNDGTSKLQFHELYRSSDDETRKLPPFHNLYYKHQGEPAATSQFQPGTSQALNTSRLTGLQFATRRLHEVDDDTRSSTSKMSESTVIHRPSNSVDSNSNDMPVVMAPLPDSYLVPCVNASQEAMRLIHLVITEKRFVFSVKSQLSFTFQLNFASLWAEHKRSILMNFVNQRWEDDKESLLPLIERCPNIKEKATAIIRANMTIEAKLEMMEREVNQGSAKDPQKSPPQPEHAASGSKAIENTQSHKQTSQPAAGGSGSHVKHLQPAADESSAPKIQERQPKQVDGRGKPLLAYPKIQSPPHVTTQRTDKTKHQQAPEVAVSSQRTIQEQPEGEIPLELNIFDREIIFFLLNFQMKQPPTLKTML